MAARLGVLFGCALLFAGCPGDAGIGDTLARDTLPAPPPVATPQPGAPAAQQVSLAAHDGSGVTGVATVTPHDAATVVAATVENAPASAVLPVRLHTGTCADQGPERAALEPIRTDARGTGTMESTVELPAHEVMTGQHFVLVYVAAGEPHRGIACGDIPARPDLHPGLERP